MWNSEADKYWKEKQKLKRREQLLKKVAAGASLVAVVIVIYVASAVREMVFGRLQGAILLNATDVDVSIPIEILTSCKSECRVKAIDQCNDICRFAHQELPRPTIFRACQAPCIKVAQSMCDLGTNEKPFLRKQCRNSGETLAFQICKEYENALPRPRTQQVCNLGSKSAPPFACDYAQQCINRALHLEEL